MRPLGLAFLFSSFTLILTAPGHGQPGRPTPGQGFGNPGGGQDAVGLIRNPAIVKELDISPEQMEKLPEALMKALGDILKPDQLKRLKQIELQQKGPQAFLDAKVQEKLKMTDEQKSNLKTILEDSRKEMAETAKEFRGGNFADAFKKMASLRQETNEKVQGVLTSEQKSTWKKMIGEEFKMPAFVRPGGFGEGDKKGFPFRKKEDSK